jgi:hypothetical protein
MTNKLKINRLPSHKAKNPLAERVREYNQKHVPMHRFLHQTMQYKKELNEAKSCLQASDADHGFKTECDCIILSRVLGHPEIQNSQLWKLTDQCWVCEKWKYTVVFFDKDTRRETRI